MHKTVLLVWISLAIVVVVVTARRSRTTDEGGTWRHTARNRVVGSAKRANQDSHHHISHKNNIDCHQFKSDLVECLASNLFMKNSERFLKFASDGLGSGEGGGGGGNLLAKPVLTKQFENKWALAGDNVTFTCEAQMDALPVFLFYKLDKSALDEYQSGVVNEDTSALLDKYAKSLQNKNALSFFETTDRRVVLERREHTLDSSKDPLADFETVYLKITQLVPDDTGYYLCIVANSVSSFRVTYAFLNVTARLEQPTTPLAINANEHKNQTIETTVVVVDVVEWFSNFVKQNTTMMLMITFVMILAVLISCCYVRVVHYRLRKRGLINEQQNRAGKDGADNEDKRLNGFLQKTISSMKQNFVYVTMSEGSSSSLKKSNEQLINQQRQQIDNELTPRPRQYDQQRVTMRLNEMTSRNTAWDFPAEKLKLGPLIDEGAFGRVYMAEAYGIQPGEYKTIVAVKTLKDSPSASEIESFMNEVEIMKSVGKHPNILSLLGCCCHSTTPAHVYAIIEYARHGNLRNYLRSQRPKDYMLSMSNNLTSTQTTAANANSLKMNSLLKLYSSVNKMKFSPKSSLAGREDDFMVTSSSSSSTSSSSSPSSPIVDHFDPITSSSSSKSCLDDPLVLELVDFCIQIAAGMSFLHDKNVCHRDLAARNVLLDDLRVAKIADFGLARDLKHDYYYRRSSDSPIPIKWMSPESLFDRKFYPSSDVWSFGVLMWEVFTLGGNPYPSVAVESLFDYLKEGNRMSRPVYADDRLYALMLECWQFKAEMRPSFASLHDQLVSIRRQYEQQVKLREMEKLFDEHQNVYFNNDSMAANNNRNQHQQQQQRQNRLMFSTPKPSTKLLASSSLATAAASRRRQSESEDSQYFSGADSSLIYNEGSNYSTSSSLTTAAATVPPPSLAPAPALSTFSSSADRPSAVVAASKALSLAMNASISHAPPSPPTLTHFATLLDVVAASNHL